MNRLERWPIPSSEPRMLRFALYDPLNDAFPLEWCGNPWLEDKVTYQDIREGIATFNDFAARDYDVLLALAVFQYNPEPEPKRRGRKS